MKIRDIISVLEEKAPPALQEDYDNAGLITGNPHWDCSGVMVSLDATESVIREAKERGCNLLVSHHPIVFRGLKKITGRTYVEQALIYAIKHDIALYAIHTNLDNVSDGVSGWMANKLDLQDQKVLVPKKGLLEKLELYVPHAEKGRLLDALFAAGAGHIGEYSECSFSTTGEGSFKAGDAANPFVGERGQRHLEPETKLELVYPSWLSGKVLQAMRQAHPYEEIAYQRVALNNTLQTAGSGIIGNLPNKMNISDFLSLLKQKFNVPVIRHSGCEKDQVSRVALCGGSGSFLTGTALSAGADAYVTADIKYHEFFDAEGKMLLADIGHFESEQFTIDLLHDILREKFPTFAVLKTAVQTNPVRYFT